MTIKDGFKFGVGLILAQLVLGIVALALTIPTLYLIGTTVKEKATSYMLGLPTESETSK